MAGWEKKVWGRVMHVFHSEHVAVSYLEVDAGYRCSRHIHQYRDNMFIVVEGTVLVEQWRYDQPSPQRTILLSGHSLNVPARIPHRFRVIDSGKLIEVYQPTQGKVSLDDIVRFDVGGVDEE
jgi:mannose-6-phosphate isomerase-like protein (cupin superfamily)